MTNDHAIAVVGISLRVPGATTLDAYWANLRDGVDSISLFSADELVAWGGDPQVVCRHDYVPARGVIEGADRFDGAFFGYSDAESALMDPQHRILLEASWSALEDAGHAPGRIDGRVAVFMGTGPGQYLRHHVDRSALADAAGDLQVQIANAPDFLATRIAYQLDLRGPAMTVQTACSTSLVGVHMGVQSLLTHEADLVLTGASIVAPPERRGHVHQPGGIGSPDGRCRVFDRASQGTVFSDGVVVLVLRRLADALRDGDHVHGLIIGSAVGNDGALKAGFTAPGIEGQADTIAAALAAAGVSADAIDAVEAHGTGTALGDPVELAALGEVFAHAPAGIALTAVKSNIGHLDVAAGAAGLVKMLLAMRHGTIPPVVHFESPNAHLPLDDTPFTIVGSPVEWPRRPDRPRRSGVSSFGIGGTNAHVVLEEAPHQPERVQQPGPVLLPLSARTEEALRQRCRDLATHLRRTPSTPLGDVARTLNVGRARMPWRTSVVAGSTDSAANRLDAAAAGELPRPIDGDPVAVLLFPGQGAQRLDMAGKLCETDEIVRRHFDHGADLVGQRLGIDLREILHGDGDRDERTALLDGTRVAQPALFVAEYAIGRALLDRDVRPALLLGHSVGEYAAACLAGVFSFEDGVALVLARAAAMAAAAPGGMLTVLAAADLIADRLPDEVSIAAVNAPEVTVLSGPLDALAVVEAELRQAGLTCTRLRTSHAFHTASMEDARRSFRPAFTGVTLNAPRIPLIAGTTGTLMTEDQAVDPEYWCDQLREPVLFSRGVDTALAAGADAWVEVGPGRALRALVRDHRQPPDALVVGVDGDGESVLRVIGELWTRGHGDLLFALGHGRRVPLPTYPFAPVRHWVDAAPRQEQVPVAAPAPEEEPDDLLSALWAEVLGARPPTEDTDFFDVGGHSLAALRLVGRIRDRLGVEVDLEEFFDAPTLVALRTRIGSAADLPLVGDEVTAPVVVEPPTRADRVGVRSPDRAVGEPAGGKSEGHGLVPTPSIYFFSARPDGGERGGYGLVLAAARLADELGFEAIWTPERHFHPFGGLFPNPAVLSAALATVTDRISLRAGSVVLPLHHPVRVVEEWSVVERISGGRVGLSFASGFHPVDFVLAPDRYARRREEFFDRVDLVRRLWRGEPYSGPSGTGTTVQVRPFPGAVRPELPVWLTASASDETFREAGRGGLNLLTAMLTITPEQLAAKLELYRDGREAAGLDRDTGHVTLMVHTYVGADDEDVREVCRAPFCGYLERHTELVDSEIRANGGTTLLDAASPRDREAILKRSFAGFYDRRSLMGDQAEVAARLVDFGKMGVSEVAGLIDFGLDDEQVLAGLERLWDSVEQARRSVR